ncbi:cinnamycin family lantibiotic [Argonema galeatum]|uniref:cinnamycin family lantibiotic n=1 Tax=Argonema galeatum TaxID=2942762 RepID=UPI0020136952|nr:cinnamycin family lantibiotic [Argonema galeatum]MCL1467482.1 cinnamycin family lantibiotic [Argonema galeatum A003/A1]
MSVTLQTKPSIEYLEQLLQMAAIDADFSTELRNHPEAFGINVDMEFSLPMSVQKQDESFVELLNDALGQLDIMAQCASTCSAGPLTIVCDGTTK